LWVVWLLLFLLSPPALADAIADAKQLLRVSNTEDHFQALAADQVRDIIRTYSSIVSMTVDVRLPREVTSNIADCYARVYAWENFEQGIAEIIAEQLSQKEILLLTDFYQDLSLPPMEIDTFKGAIAKAPQLERVSADYIFSHSGNCVEHSSLAIRRYLSEHYDLQDLLSADS